MKNTDILSNHAKLTARKVVTKEKLVTLEDAFGRTDFFKDKPVSVFVAGSLGRGDVGSNSDLDLFVISEPSNKRRPKLEDLETLAKLIEINRDLRYPPFSNDGQFLKIYSIDEMRQTLGDPNDDSENLFTTRMLLLLESVPICNHLLYESHIKSIVEHYFRDYPDHKVFKPLFLLNDILRYWRTLCLNYERIRNDNGKPWRKKNINLKFSRMLTVFGTVLPLIALPIKDAEQFINLTAKTPLERLAIGLDNLNDSSLTAKFSGFLDDYEQFLCWKEDAEVEEKMQDPGLKIKSQESARRFSEFLPLSLTHPGIEAELRKFLVI